ncbi:MAG: WD40 repeat domain-containing protein, partial [Treponema sp.]|nr:WD40 repeat domain-containing protein [Treponema sp.]
MKKRSPSFCILSLVTMSLLAGSLSAQSYLSCQQHDGAVTVIATKANDQSFFTAGNDGFLVKWNGINQGERYQIGDLPIEMLDLNPAGDDVAAYESDGMSTNRLSVYDWNSLNRRFAKRFKSPLTCLSYSARGTYLFVGTSTTGGIYILNARTGETLKNIKTIPGMITMARTGDSEKTAIMYSPSGYLYYWDMKKGNVKVKFSTETSLSQPCLFGSGKYQNRFFAGIKRNTIYVIDATNGTTLATYNATNPRLARCAGDYEEGLFSVSDKGRGYSLSLISCESLENYIKSPDSRNGSLPSSSLVKNFMGLKGSDAFCSIA